MNVEKFWNSKTNFSISQIHEQIILFHKFTNKFFYFTNSRTNFHKSRSKTLRELRNFFSFSRIYERKKPIPASTGMFYKGMLLDTILIIQIHSFFQLNNGLWSKVCPIHLLCIQSSDLDPWNCSAWSRSVESC